MRWFAKGIGAARSNDVATACAAIGELKALHKALTARGQDYRASLTEAQTLNVEAWIELLKITTNLLGCIKPKQPISKTQSAKAR
ncbi:MAG: hypothetical protein WBC93_21475 [Sulfitobacter sp.]